MFDQENSLGVNESSPHDEKLQRNLFNILLSSFFLLIGLHHMACEQSVEPKPVIEEVSYGILPLKVGYYWDYKTYALKEDSSTGLEVERINYKITRISFDPSQKKY